jgi:hypothetical protein
MKTIDPLNLIEDTINWTSSFDDLLSAKDVYAFKNPFGTSIL